MFNQQSVISEDMRLTKVYKQETYKEQDGNKHLSGYECWQRVKNGILTNLNGKNTLLGACQVYHFIYVFSLDQKLFVLMNMSQELLTNLSLGIAV